VALEKRGAELITGGMPGATFGCRELRRKVYSLYGGEVGGQGQKFKSDREGKHAMGKIKTGGKRISVLLTGGGGQRSLPWGEGAQKKKSRF